MEFRMLGPDDEAQARAAHAELAAEGFAFLPFLMPGEPWADYLVRTERLSRGDGLPPGVVPSTDLYGLVDGVVVGQVSVRHRLTDAIMVLGGHISYGVRPAHRRRGYGTALLRAGLSVARHLGIEQALVTCGADNAASRAVIERCGGVLEDVRPAPDGRPTRRYWVPTVAATPPGTSATGPRPTRTTRRDRPAGPGSARR